MFIRKVVKKNKGFDKEFFYLHLVESIRTPNGPRQKLVLNLGALDIPEEKYAELAKCIEDKITGNNELFESSHDENIALYAQDAFDKLFKKQAISVETPEDEDFALIKENSIKISKPRQIGAENICLDIWQDYKLDEFLSKEGISTDWITTIKAQIIGRMIYPGSDLATWEWLNDCSGFYDLIEKPNKDSLSTFYRSADVLWNLKTAMEKHLKAKSDEIFQLKRKLCLLDLTNTYFEGAMTKVSKAIRGRSKEKRSDCKIITVGMMIDENGFPEHSMLFDGNISEPKSLKIMLDKLAFESNQTKPTVLMDAGIGTKDNVEYLISKGYPYIVVSRRDSNAIKKDEMTPLKVSKCGTSISVKRVEEENGEILLYCHSDGKEEKENSILEKQSSKFTESLDKLLAGLSKNKGTKEYTKILMAIGRIKEKYPKVAQLYQIDVTPDENKKNAIDIKWGKNDKKTRDAGIYLLRTDRKDLNDEEIWDTYVTLTRIEKTFRTIKCDTGMRPNYHNKETRVETHIFISIMAYHLINAIEYKMRMQKDFRTWDTIREIMKTHAAITISYIFKDKNQEIIKKIIRDATEPEECHKQIYNSLNIKGNDFKKKSILLKM